MATAGITEHKIHQGTTIPIKYLWSCCRSGRLPEHFVAAFYVRHIFQVVASIIYDIVRPPYGYYTFGSLQAKYIKQSSVTTCCIQHAN